CAISPNIDHLAASGARFENAFSHAPVCAPSRGGLVSGQYPTAVGFHHHRSRLARAPQLFTSYLREAGYHVSWPGKQDFNFAPPPGSFCDQRDWFGELPREPFFVYANLFQTHESNLREPDDIFMQRTAGLRPDQRHDPDVVEVPAYLPDTPAVRREIARHHDNVTAIDQQVGAVLQQIDEAGLAENTVVIFLADHGRGLPREKRWVYDHGIHMPLIIRAPGLISAGTVVDDLVAWVDIAPTILSLAGIKIPADFHGQAFLGAQRSAPRQYVFAARDRLDETTDCVRAVRSTRYKYIRNLMPYRSHAQPISYMEKLATMKSMRIYHAAGLANPVQAAFFNPTKPAEELYDVVADPWELCNLSADPAMAAQLSAHRKALDDWTAKFGDLGVVREMELLRRGVILPEPVKA
ncbi:MAG TPA: sulfatase, partial [Roseimicrobium sp.]|nr:sulfatase [Roseimicrobium sp.]